MNISSTIWRIFFQLSNWITIPWTHFTIFSARVVNFGRWIGPCSLTIWWIFVPSCYWSPTGVLHLYVTLWVPKIWQISSNIIRTTIYWFIPVNCKKTWKQSRFSPDRFYSVEKQKQIRFKVHLRTVTCVQ